MLVELMPNQLLDAILEKLRWSFSRRIMFPATSPPGRLAISLIGSNRSKINCRHQLDLMERRKILRCFIIPVSQRKKSLSPCKNQNGYFFFIRRLKSATPVGNISSQGFIPSFFGAKDRQSHFSASFFGDFA